MATDVRDHVDNLEAQLRRTRDEPEAIAASVEGHRPVDIADGLNRVAEAVPAVVAALSPATTARVLHEAAPETQRHIVHALGVIDAAIVLALLPMDEATRVIEALPPKLRDELLAALPEPERRDIDSLLSYPARSAGRLMTEQFPTVDVALTASAALDRLRHDEAGCETITDLYAVDAERRLTGVVSLRELVMADPAAPVQSLLTTDVIAVAPTATQEDAARLVSRYDFLALPVVDDDRRILGIITVDDVIDVLVREAGEDLLKMGSAEGGGVLNQPYFSVPITRVVRKRIGWLLLLFVAETATGSVLRVFDDELAKVVALSFFIPLLIGTGGNTGAQTVSTLIRGLALAEVRVKDIWRVLRREVASGFLLGLLLGTVGFFRSLLWHSGTKLSLVVAITLVAICTWANTIGAMIPLVATRFRIDPALVSAPLITTLVDATGLAIYLLVAKAILGL